MLRGSCVSMPTVTSRTGGTGGAAAPSAAAAAAAAWHAVGGRVTSDHGLSTQSATGVCALARGGHEPALPGASHHAISCAPQRTSSLPSWHDTVQ